MAIAPDILHVIHAPPAPREQPRQPGPAQAGADAAQQQRPQEWRREFNKNSFLIRESSRPGLDTHERPTGNQEEQLVTFYEPLRAQYREFLHNYAVNLHESTDRARKMNQNFSLPREDSMLLKKLVGNDERPSIEKINEYLEDTRNWEDATLAMDRQAARLMAAIHMDAVMNPDREYFTQVDSQTIRLGVDEGDLREVWEHTLRPWLTENVNRTGNRPNPPGILPQLQLRWQRFTAGAGIAGIIGGGLGVGVGSFAGPGGAVAGFAGGTAAVAGLEAVANGLGRMMREGVQINTRDSVAMFEALTRDPQELALVSHITGINLGALEVVGGAIRERAGQRVTFLKTPKEIQREALGILTTRQEFFGTLGIPHERLDATDRQWLLPGRPHEPEQLAFRGYIDIHDEFTRLGGLRPNAADNLQRWAEASANVTIRKGQWEIEEVERKREKEGMLSGLESRAAGVSEWRAARGTEHKDRAAAYSTARESLNTEFKTVDEYRVNVVEFQQGLARKSAENRAARGRILASVRQPGLGGAAGAAFANERAAIAALHGILDTAGTSIVINGQTIASIIDRQTALDTAKQAEYKAVRRGNPPAAGENVTLYERRIKPFYDRVDNQYRPREERINREKDLIQQTVVQLEEVVKPTETTISDNLKETNQSVAKASQEINRVEGDFSRINSWAGPGIMLFEGDLATRSVSDLLRSINAANGVNPNMGWPENQNNNTEYILQVVRAVAEARARTASSDVASPGAVFDRLTGRNGTVPRWNTSEHELLILTAVQIRELLDDRRSKNPARYGAATGIGGVPSVRDIENARVAAVNRLNARDEALREMVIALKMEEEAEKGFESRYAGERRGESPVDMIRGLAQQHDRLMNAAQVMEAVPGRYFDQTAVDPNDPELSETERATYTFTPPGGAAVTRQYSRGYLEFMNQLFLYQQEGKRNELFKAASEFFPPDQLAIVTDEAIRPAGVVGPPSNDIDDVFTRLQPRILSGEVSRTSLRRMLDSIVIRAGRRELARPLAA